jgi:hypothetical protein
MARHVETCSWTFKVGNFDPKAFDYARSAEVAEIYLRGSGYALLGPAVFESATPVPGSYKPSTGGMTDVVFTAPCAARWPSTT